MSDNRSYTESILDIVKAVQADAVMLPEFQRDFRWELDQTYDLFDSLAHDIFIGTIIYGKPSFALSVRKLDDRSRKSEGRRRPIKPISLDEETITEKVKVQNFRIVLDGQQRITALYRAIIGCDNVYMVLNETWTQTTFEEMIDSFGGEEREDRICVKLNDAYLADLQSQREHARIALFLETKYARARAQYWDANPTDKETAIDAYLDAMGLLINLYRREKLVSYYMLDMNVDKFCTFFERSNSRGIQLDFTDILAAKLYIGFNLREAFDTFEEQHPSGLRLNRELIIRAIAYLTGDGSSKIDKGYILKNLKPDDFKGFWNEVCDLYEQAFNYLVDGHFIISQAWMPSENIMLPLMIFIREVGGIHNIDEEQRRFIEFWFWASIFALRYSGASNETIIEDAAILTSIAKHRAVHDNITYLRRLRPRIGDADDILTYQRKANSIYKGLLCLINYEKDGILDWMSQSPLTANQQLDDHHIFPRKFIETDRRYKDDDEAQELIDCVANRALIPKITNIKIGARSPSKYLHEIRTRNSQIATCLQTHLIDELILDPGSDDMFKDIVSQRARDIFELVDKYAIQPATSFSNFFPITVATRVEVRIPTFVEYKGQRFEAVFIPNRERIEYDGRLLTVTHAAREIVNAVSGSKHSQNGWKFWKYFNESGEERPISDLRDQS